MSEGSMNAAIAGHFSVPVIMVSGEDMREISNFLIFVTNYRIDLQP